MEKAVIKFLHRSAELLLRVEKSVWNWVRGGGEGQREDQAQKGAEMAGESSAKSNASPKTRSPNQS